VPRRMALAVAKPQRVRRLSQLTPAFFLN
jgi:hypothetical protein